MEVGFRARGLAEVGSSVEETKVYPVCEVIVQKDFVTGVLKRTGQT